MDDSGWIGRIGQGDGICIVDDTAGNREASEGSERTCKAVLEVLGNLTDRFKRDRTRSPAAVPRAVPALSLRPSHR